MTRKRLGLVTVLCLLLAVASGVCLAQLPGRFGGSPRGDSDLDDRRGVPDWKVDEKFKSDVFTFVRVEYDSGGGFRGGGGFGGFRGGGGRRRGGFGGGGWGGGGGFGGRWAIDFPDSDLNFSFRLQQLTSLKVNPQPMHMRLTDERLHDYPFLYLIEPGWLSFSPEEVEALKHYLLNGGFLMVDDFWGEDEWQNFYREMQRVFPDRDYVELPIEHEIFRCVYRLKEKPQVPSIGHAQWGRAEGITWENHGPGSEEVHYRAYFDDKQRMMVIMCHNTDLGDGWEREGQDEWYFHEFCEKKSYPMGINIVTYAMTH
jgi:hypothetical protein